jgi:hypothetical protein
MGGGVRCHERCSPAFEDCVFSNHVATSRGGAVLCGAFCSPSFANCVFEGNLGVCGAAVSSGGDACPTFVDCAFIDNWAAGEAAYGGALQCMHYSSPTLHNCTFSGNAADERGGVAYCYGESSPIFTNCTLVGSSAPAGGALYCWENCYPELDNCVIAFGLEGGAAAAQDGCGPVLRCCDVYGNAGGDWVDCIADQYGVDGNFSADPLFCDAGSGDLSLHTDSPCLPGYNPECGLVGAWAVGCPSAGIRDEGPCACAGMWLAPNPFTFATRVTYSPAGDIDPSAVMLGVYDTAGRLVRTLVAGAPGGDLHTISWDGTDHSGRALAGGVYFYRLDLGSERVTSRVILLR